MHIGILVPFMNNFGEKGFYNSQEVGLGKALVKLGHKVDIFKLIKAGIKKPENQTIGNLDITYISAKSIGSNGFVDTRVLNPEIEALICFSDMQLTIPKVYRWCKKHNIIFIPYIGATESHSPHRAVRTLSNMMFSRNVRVFRNCKCLAKNENVCRALQKMAIKEVRLAPVGIDTDLLNHEYSNAPRNVLLEKYGYQPEDRILLFIGRLEEEKEPLQLIRAFSKLKTANSNLKLLVVGKGPLQGKMIAEITKKQLEKDVQYIEQIPNDQIWELYRICSWVINLNQQEIFGMVLLEAMYYETIVIAWHAPGPDFIIDDRQSGYLISNESELEEIINHSDEEIRRRGHERVMSLFTWKSTAAVVQTILQ